MPYYTIYVGGERKDRATTQEDVSNVTKVLSLNTSNGCFTRLKKDNTVIAQLEHVLNLLVSISYIEGENNLNAVIDMIKATGITAYTIVYHGNDEECLNELSYADYTI